MISRTMKSVKNRVVGALLAKMVVSALRAITCSPSSTTPASQAISIACTHRLIPPPKTPRAFPMRVMSWPRNLLKIPASAWFHGGFDCFAA